MLRWALGNSVVVTNFKCQELGNFDDLPESISEIRPIKNI
jgi:hypothetical protein